MHIADEEGIMAECPTCGATIPLDSASCPQCGEVFSTEGDEGAPLEEPAVVEPARAAAAPGAVAVAAPRDEGLPVEEELEPGLVGELEEDLEKKPSFLFWLGLILIAAGFFGGPVLSYLHDALKIPIGTFTAYYAFGWVNWIVTIVGTVVLAIGVVLLIIGWIKIKKWRDALEEPLHEMEEFKTEDIA